MASAADVDLSNRMTKLETTVELGSGHNAERFDKLDQRFDKFENALPALVKRAVEDALRSDGGAPPRTRRGGLTNPHTEPGQPSRWSTAPTIGQASQWGMVLGAIATPVASGLALGVYGAWSLISGVELPSRPVPPPVILSAPPSGPAPMPADVQE